MSEAVRLVEIDLFRGIAILLMIIFHTVFDLAFYYNWPLDYLDGFWYYQGKASAVLFMLVSGVSSLLSRHPVRRGLTVFGTGLLITAATYFYSPAVYIRFGILHLLGVGMLAAPFFNQRSALLLIIAGTSIIAIGNGFSQITATTACLVPFGIKPPSFTSLDYYPLFPWLGIILYGMAAGRLLYPARQPLWPSLANHRSVRWLSWMGRRSLLIYLMHQPVILAILYIINP
ncbi:heparan-alpha-glucosaminide N-acetyltransferase [Sporomusa sp.]|uniref:heparan-alpha-glucosaminide N-acetyltransferase n=1 Tax=Sporomusa sp. TaxID=2078658 RepID=UPI002BCF1D50|nr:heparan-alpha-glucosaminide N-acetyltransferase [Sporomusa sp.]HWR42347.1 heparan-alpha-glucosaminide N-acetyltransferase [Sporomusa sp.]